MNGTFTTAAHRIATTILLTPTLRSRYSARWTPEAHRNWGITLAKAGRLAEAAGPLAEAARLRPDDARAWEELAALHHQRADLPALIEYRRRIADLRPDDPGLLGEWN